MLHFGDDSWHQQFLELEVELQSIYRCEHDGEEGPDSLNLFERYFVLSSVYVQLIDYGFELFDFFEGEGGLRQ